jgi:chromosome segregation ATPase
LKRTRDELAETTNTLEKTAAELGEHREGLEALRAAHSKLTDQFQTTDKALSETRQTLALSQDSLRATQGLLDESNESVARLTSQLATAQNLADERRVAIAALETRVATAQGELNDVRRRLGAAQDVIVQRDASIAALIGERDVARTALAEIEGQHDEAKSTIERAEARYRKQKELLDEAKDAARGARKEAQEFSLAMVRLQAELRQRAAVVERNSSKKTKERAASNVLSVVPKEPAAETEELPDSRVVRLPRNRRNERDIKQAAE